MSNYSENYYDDEFINDEFYGSQGFLEDEFFQGEAGEAADEAISSRSILHPRVAYRPVKANNLTRPSRSSAQTRQMMQRVNRALANLDKKMKSLEEQEESRKKQEMLELLGLFQPQIENIEFDSAEYAQKASVSDVKYDNSQALIKLLLNRKKTGSDSKGGMDMMEILLLSGALGNGNSFGSSKDGGGLFANPLMMYLFLSK